MCIVGLVCISQWLTSGNDALQSDNVGVVELAHNAGLAEEVSSLFLWISCLQTFDGHVDLSLAGKLQTAAANLTKLTWGMT